VKTTDNCFVYQPQLTEPVDQDSLDNCGPEASLSIHNSSAPGPSRRATQSPQLLANFTVGSDFARCYHEPNNSTRPVRVYPYPRWVIVQCGVHGANGVDWLFTTDFCYVNSADFDEDPYGGEYNDRK
jgi:hypothetical protein